MANVSLQRSYTLTAGGPNAETFNRNEISVLGLPSLMYWVRLNSAFNGVIFTPLFAVQNVTIGGVAAPSWLPFNNGAVLVPGNVFVFTIRAAVAQAAAEFTLPGFSSVDVDVVITAGG
jgi:hypothetical protein